MQPKPKGDKTKVGRIQTSVGGGKMTKVCFGVGCV